MVQGRQWKLYRMCTVVVYCMVVCLGGFQNEPCAIPDQHGLMLAMAPHMASHPPHRSPDQNVLEPTVQENTMSSTMDLGR